MFQVAHATATFKVRGTSTVAWHSAIKLGDNPSTTTSIFAMRTGPAVGRRLTAIGSAKLVCFLSLHTQIGLFHFFLGTNCFETIPLPLGVVTAALRRATAYIKEKP